MSKKRNNRRFILFCTLPALLAYTIFMIIPTFNVFKMSLYKWTGFSGNPKFVGLANFKTLMDDKNFVRAFQNTLVLLVVVTAITIFLALLLAAIMKSEQLKGRNIFRYIIYIPNILSIVVIAAIFSAIYDQDHGLLNSLLNLLHLEAWKHMWLGDQKIVVYSVGFALIWQAAGYYMVMYAASMASIPDSLYESASIDGATSLKQFFSITVPLIWQNIRNTLTFFIITSVNMTFVLVNAMTSGGPDGSSEVLLSYMYKQAYTNSSYGYGMAIGVVIFLYSFLLSLVVSRITYRETLQY